MALSSFRFASSPDFTVSTLWPSRRRAMSNISQMERSSSHTRMLPMRSTSPARRNRFPGLGKEFWLRSRRFGRQALYRRQAAQPEHEDAALSNSGARPHFAFMRLYDLIYDGQAQSGAAFELRLEGLEDFLHQLPAHAWTGIGEVDLPVLTRLFQRDAEHSTGAHGADCVLTKIPEHLFDLVAVRHGEGFFEVVTSFNADTPVLCHQPVLQQ